MLSGLCLLLYIPDTSDTLQDLCQPIPTHIQSTDRQLYSSCNSFTLFCQVWLREMTRNGIQYHDPPDGPDPFISLLLILLCCLA